MTKRILSCVQPTGHLHLGNYLGALKNWVKLQNEGGECFYGVVDLHSVTIPYDRDEKANLTREVAAAYIASGVDPKKSTLFVQSFVPAHSQLMWLLSTMTQMGKLERMTQFKDKAGKNAERVGLGLFAYPVLMAADILLYKATHVPVGEDQKQHLELTREVASTFNTRYDVDFFVQPEPYIIGAARVMSLRDGTKKMSGSAESDMTRINMTDDADLMAKKIKKAKTDSAPLPESLEGLEDRPEAANLVAIYASLAELSKEDVLAAFAGKEFSVFKPALTDLAVAKLSPITTRITELLNDKAELDKILREGSEKANAVAAPVVKETMEIMGFLAS